MPGCQWGLVVEGLELGSLSLTQVARKASLSPPFYEPGHWISCGSGMKAGPLVLGLGLGLALRAPV